MFKQQVIGIINLSFPLIILFLACPELMLLMWVQIVCSVILGGYIYFIGKLQIDRLNNSLIYSPSGKERDFLDQLVRDCGVDPSSIKIKYAYIPEGLALTSGTTIIVDPVMFDLFNEDRGAERVKEVFILQFEPMLSSIQKTVFDQLRKEVNPAVFRFIFKHELGHVVARYSLKKLCVNAIIICITSFIGIKTAVLIMPFSRVAAALSGMVVWGICDLLLSYASNVLFKLKSEKNADLFAVQYSSSEDTRTAAGFFKKHQDIIDILRDKKGFWGKVPSVILSGHLHGHIREKWLLGLLNHR
jgi:hypothetical protein